MSVTGLKVSVLNINNNEYEIKDAESRNDITLINEAIEGLSTRVQILESGSASGTIDLHLSSNYTTSTGTGIALNLVSGTTYEEAFSKLEKKINDNDLKIPTPTISDNNKVLMVVSGTYKLVLTSTLYSGTGAPNNANGNNGDIYVQTTGE